MHLKSTFFYGLAIASAVVAQSTIAEGLTTISAQLTSFNQAVAAWNGDVLEGAKIFLQSQDFLGAMTKISAAASTTAPMQLNQAVPMLEPSNKIIALTESLIDNLISKKAALDKSQLSPIVRDTLIGSKASAAKLVETIQSKVPPNVRPLAASITDKIIAALERGIKAYS